MLFYHYTMSTSHAQQEIEKHMKAIQQIKEKQFIQDIIDVLQDKHFTKDQLIVACAAFLQSERQRMRELNLVKARKARVKKTEEKPIPA